MCNWWNKPTIQQQQNIANDIHTIAQITLNSKVNAVKETTTKAKKR
jgi:hypothetical protein